MKKLLVYFMLLASLAFADEMPKGSKQFEALQSIVGGAALGGMGGVVTPCPTQLQIPGVQISCAAVFTPALSVPGGFDRARIDRSVPLEPTSNTWVFHPYEQSFEQVYTFSDGSTFRVVYDGRDGVVVNVAAYYTP